MSEVETVDTQEIEPEFVDPVAQQIAEAEREFAERPEAAEAVDGEQTEEDGVPTEEEFEAAEAAANPVPERSTGFEWALEQIIQVNQEAIEQKARVKEAQAALKDEKETLENIQDQLNRLIQEAAKLKSQGEPDPDRYPLLDRKAELNGLFARPEAIPPLPADTEEEHYRRLRRDTRFDGIAMLKPKVVEILAGAGFHTVMDLDKLGDRDLTSIRSDAGSITEKRAEEIRDALGALTLGWAEAWAKDHPEPVAEPEAATDAADVTTEPVEPEPVAVAEPAS